MPETFSIRNAYRNLTSKEQTYFRQNNTSATIHTLHTLSASIQHLNILWDDLIISQLQAIFQLFSSHPPPPSGEFCQVN